MCVSRTVKLDILFILQIRKSGPSTNILLVKYLVYSKVLIKWKIYLCSQNGDLWRNTQYI